MDSASAVGEFEIVLCCTAERSEGIGRSLRRRFRYHLLGLFLSKIVPSKPASGIYYFRRPEKIRRFRRGDCVGGVRTIQNHDKFAKNGLTVSFMKAPSPFG
jgi:hypothetical protein